MATPSLAPARHIAPVPLVGREWLLLAEQDDGSTAPLGIAELAPAIPRVVALRGRPTSITLQFRRAASIAAVARKAARAMPAFQPPVWGVLHPPTVCLSTRVLSLTPEVPVTLGGGGIAVVWLTDPGVTRLIERLHDQAAKSCLESAAALAAISGACTASLSMDPRRVR
jgi:hypothetical protein